MEILKLLQSKNRCLKKLLSYCERFLSEIQQSDFSKLDAFQKDREKIFQTFLLFDRRISLVQHELRSTGPDSAAWSSIKIAIQSVLREQETTTQAILNLDQKISQILEAEKTKIQENLSQADKQKQIIQKFKSSWVSESGIKLDGVL